MTETEIRRRILTLLGNMAPEVEPTHLKPDVGIREQIDVDSMDLLNFMIALHKEFCIEIPERDYSKLQTINSCVTYVERAIQQ